MDAAGERVAGVLGAGVAVVTVDLNAGALSADAGVLLGAEVVVAAQQVIVLQLDAAVDRIT